MQSGPSCHLPTPALEARPHHCLRNVWPGPSSPRTCLCAPLSWAVPSALTAPGSDGPPAPTAPGSGAPQLRRPPAPTAGDGGQAWVTTSYPTLPGWLPPEKASPVAGPAPSLAGGSWCQPGRTLRPVLQPEAPPEGECLSARLRSHHCAERGCLVPPQPHTTHRRSSPPPPPRPQVFVLVPSSALAPGSCDRSSLREGPPASAAP